MNIKLSHHKFHNIASKKSLLSEKCKHLSWNKDYKHHKIVFGQILVWIREIINGKWRTGQGGDKASFPHKYDHAAYNITAKICINTSGVERLQPAELISLCMGPNLVCEAVPPTCPMLGIILSEAVPVTVLGITSGQVWMWFKRNNKELKVILRLFLCKQGSLTESPTGISCPSKVSIKNSLVPSGRQSILQERMLLCHQMIGRWMALPMCQSYPKCVWQGWRR